MKITVKLFATLKEGRFDIEERDYPRSPSVRTVIRDLKIKKGQATIIFVNGRHALPDRKLEDGDVVALFPPVGGG